MYLLEPNTDNFVLFENIQTQCHEYLRCNEKLLDSSVKTAGKKKGKENELISNLLAYQQYKQYIAPDSTSND